MTTPNRMFGTDQWTSWVLEAPVGRGTLLVLDCNVWRVRGNRAVGEDGHFVGLGQWSFTDWQSS